jgi:hypothetical protein
MTADPTFLLVVIGLSVAALMFDRARGLNREGRTGYEAPLVMIFTLSAAAVWRLSSQTDVNVDLIATLVLAASALIGLTFNASVARQSEGRARREKRSDLRRALCAEIDDYLREVGYAQRADQPKRIRDAFASDRTYVPFICVSRRDRVYSTVLPQIEVLDKDQVETVIRYYALLDKITSLSVQTQGPDYRNLNADRRQAIMLSLIEMERTLVLYGKSALTALGDPVAAASHDAPQ